MSACGQPSHRMGPVVLAVLGNPDWSYRLGMLAWFAPHLLAWATARLAPRSDKPAD